MALELVGGGFRFEVENCEVTVVPSLVVLTVSEGVLIFGVSGTTLTGSDAPATSLGVLYVVVTVVPSLEVFCMPPFDKSPASWKSSMGMMFTGSDA